MILAIFNSVELNGNEISTEDEDEKEEVWLPSQNGMQKSWPPVDFRSLIEMRGKLKINSDLSEKEINKLYLQEKQSSISYRRR